MGLWLANNAGNLVVGAVVLGLVVGIIIKMQRDKKNGKTSCGCECKGCSLSDKCHPKK